MVEIPDLEHFAHFCSLLTLDDKSRMELRDFQRTFLTDHFDGVQETLVLIPKKNGKTTVIAALVLHHLLYVDDAEIYVAAASRDQATLLFNFAKRFVTRSPALEQRLLVRKGTREIRSRRDDGFLKVLAADADTADGVGPSLAIVDELHRHKKSDLYDVFSDGLDARGGRLITISTAGADEEGPLGVMRRNAIDDPENEQYVDGVYRRSYSAAASFAMHEWSLGRSDDRTDMALVAQANPLLSEAQLRRRFKLPSMTPARWARFACNVWAQDDNAQIAEADWAAILDTLHPLVAGTRDVVVGIDLGWTRDTSAFVPVGIRDDEDRMVDSTVFYDEDDEEQPQELPAKVPVATIGTPIIIPAPGDGSMTPEGKLKQAARDMIALYPEARFAIDPNAEGHAFAQWLEAELCGGDETRVIEYSQQPSPMADASMGLAAHIRAQALRQPGDPELDAHVLRAVAKWVNERWRFAQPAAPQRDVRRRRPIDGTIATSIGLRVLRAPKPVVLEPFAIAI